MTANRSPGCFPDRSTSVDSVFRAVADLFRRQLLDVLVADDGCYVERQTVVTALAAESERTKADVETALMPVHLPKLETAGLVESDCGEDRPWFPVCSLARQLLDVADQTGTDSSRR